jgi:alkanesulfonate monooxygenase SsuD/methylene tetrahydromethanopterin reductase-like flavin-dependent oxidoreductase (luciferase family)
MRFAINVANFGAYSDPHLVAELAHEAEESGWDGFFIWDHIAYVTRETGEYLPVADPWVELAAIAMRTKRIKLGPNITPLPRRRPWKLAREAVTLDHLSGGRLILGLGIGTDRSKEFSSFGEAADPKIHGEMLDEGLELLAKLWSGEMFNYDGNYYHLSEVRFLPPPVQRPRIPLWIAAHWPHKRPLRRAARWDGITPLKPGGEITSEEYREIRISIQQQRTSQTPFDMLAAGRTGGTDKGRGTAKMAELAEAGVTWWQECFGWQEPLDQVRQRIHQGPLRSAEA